LVVFALFAKKMRKMSKFGN